MWLLRPPGSLRGSVARLVILAYAVTYPATLCEAKQQPVGVVGAADVGAAESFSSCMNVAFRSVTDPLSARLDGRLDSQESEISQASARVAAVESKADGLAAQLLGQTTRLAELAKRLDLVQSALGTPAPSRRPRDCSDLPEGARSGVHLLYPGLDGTVPAPAFCDLESDDGNWTVFQRRADIQPRQDFFLGWAAYREGFGELDAEFWWGLERLWLATAARDRQFELRIDLEDFDGSARFAVYQGFRVSSEADGYRLSAGSYSGDAGDSLREHVGQRFSTKDKDQDNYGQNCADKYKGAWWYKACHHSNLNGLYLAGPAPEWNGMNWKAWRGSHSLKSTVMKFRPSRKLEMP